MIIALSGAANINMNPEIPGQQGDRVLHMLLNTPFKYFTYDKAETLMGFLNTGIDPFVPGRGGNTAVHILSGGGVLAQDPLGQDLLRVLLSGNISSKNIIALLNDRNFALNTPLIVAAQAHNLPQLQLLLQHGADPNVRGEFGQTALYFAVARNFIDIAEALMTFGAEIGHDVVALSPQMEAVLRI